MHGNEVELDTSWLKNRFQKAPTYRGKLVSIREAMPGEVLTIDHLDGHGPIRRTVPSDRSKRYVITTLDGHQSLFEDYRGMGNLAKRYAPAGQPGLFRERGLYKALPNPTGKSVVMYGDRTRDQHGDVNSVFSLELDSGGQLHDPYLSQFTSRERFLARFEPVSSRHRNLIRPVSPHPLNVEETYVDLNSTKFEQAFQSAPLYRHKAVTIRDGVPGERVATMGFDRDGAPYSFEEFITSSDQKVITAVDGSTVKVVTDFKYVDPAMALEKHYEPTDIPGQFRAKGTLHAIPNTTRSNVFYIDSHPDDLVKGKPDSVFISESDGDKSRTIVSRAEFVASYEPVSLQRVATPVSPQLSAAPSPANVSIRL